MTTIIPTEPIPMRVFYCVFCFIVFFCIKINAQNSADCRTAIPVCADAPIFSEANGSGDIDDFDPDTVRFSGCLEKGSVSSANIENNTSWYVFRAGTSGQVGFDIESLPVGASTTVTAEWDFAVYGPDVDCAGISSGTVDPIRCNYEVNTTSFTGLGVNPENNQVGAPFLVGSQNTYDEFIDVVEGEIYYILINNFNTNFDGDPEPYSLTFTGDSVDADQNTALDCTLRDEFLGLDITLCEGDPDVLLTALNSPAGADIASVEWTVDYDDDGLMDVTLAGTGPFGAELAVASPATGRYFATITTISGTPPTVADVSGILITFIPVPTENDVEIEVVDTNLAIDPDSNNIEITVNLASEYEYAINGGEFQDSNVFTDIPAGYNTLIVNDKNGCGTTAPIPFLVIGYPKFFTPNDDLINDSWQIEGINELENPVVYIFNRYGKLLQQLNADSVPWDGTFNGKDLPSSDYWFRLEYEEDENSILVAKLRKTHFALTR